MQSGPWHDATVRVFSKQLAGRQCLSGLRCTFVLAHPLLTRRSLCAAQCTLCALVSLPASLHEGCINNDARQQLCPSDLVT